MEEFRTTAELRTAFGNMQRVERQDFHYDKVAGKQIISALLLEVNVRFAEGFLYRVLQEVANEARRRNLLINPNPFSRETYSSAVGNTDRMLPSQTGWEQTKGILIRHLDEATEHLRTLIKAK